MEAIDETHFAVFSSHSCADLPERTSKSRELPVTRDVPTGGMADVSRRRVVQHPPIRRCPSLSRRFRTSRRSEVGEVRGVTKCVPHNVDRKL